jgi:hypothetical protein
MNYREKRTPRSITTTRERGFAVVVVLLVIVIVTLLAAGFLLIATTENRIAENERLSTQALYAAETGVGVIRTWFDRPMSTANLSNPPLSVLDRSLRLIDADGDPATAPVAADGTAALPYYKQGVDADSDGNDDVFEQPYRDSLVDTLLGTETGPDMRIDENASSAARSYLVGLSDALFADYPGKGLRARITTMDIYAPPYALSGGAWVRYGMATLKVVAGIYRQEPDGAETRVAERMVKVVLNEIPYNPGAALGPLHSCDALTWNGEFTVYWGVGTAVGAGDLHNNHDKLAVSLPRTASPAANVDLLWGYDSDANFSAYKSVIDGLRVDDPWLRVLIGGTLVEAGTPVAQPWPFTWTPGNPLQDGDLPYHPGPPGPHPYPTSWDGTHSNVFHNTTVDCPEYDYHLWKRIAMAGGSGAHYYAWDSGSSFREDGVGPAQTFRSITDQQTGLFFFDTMDGLAPHDDDSDGVYDNLTPSIKISGSRWGVRGFIYLNAAAFQTNGVSGRAATFNSPGEPYQDENANGKWDFGENWINLAYPTSLSGKFMVNAADTFQDDGTTGGLAVRNTRGPSIAGEALIWGIFFNNGYYDATGNGVYYGTVISKQGIGEFSPSAGTPEHYWDESLNSKFPPDDWGLPRVAITRWETDI